MRVYHLSPKEFALNNVERQRIKVSRFSDLNDPFELLAVNVGGRKGVRAALREWKTSLNDKKGLLCFSRAWKNPVLWSHYADKHKGICLGFDVDDSLLQSVDYAPARVLRRFNDGIPIDLDHKLVDVLFRTKYEHWKYEDEVRMLVNLADEKEEKGLYFHSMSRAMVLREVILGPLCDVRLDDVRKSVDALYDSVTVIQSRLAFKFFQVVPKLS
jgi:Protein of unknown function (DUF2971)